MWNSTVALLCLVIFFVLNIKADEEYPPKILIEMLKPIHDYCAQEIGVAEEILQSYDVTTNNDRNVKCYMACFMKQSNWLSDVGEIKYDFIIDNPWEPIRDIMITDVNKCRGIEVLDDECEYIYQFARCIERNDPEHWFLP